MPEFDIAGGQRPEEERTLLNRFFDTLKWMSPLVNLGRLGQVEPPAAFLRDGMIAYADGTNWNPGWGPGYYRYELSLAHWNPIGPQEAHKSYHMRSQAGTAGTYYGAGFYTFSASNANLTQASTTVTHGGANVSYAAHAFIVFGAATGSGGTGVDRKVKLTVTGTRIQDDGTRTASYTETLTDDAESLTLNDMIEGEKYLGTVTFTLSATGVDPYTAYSMDFNYGLCKYDDLGNNTFHITTFECVGYGGANDSGFNIELLHHTTTGWTYSAAAFVPDPPVITDMNTVHVTEVDVDNNDYIVFKQTGLEFKIEGAANEGFVIRITTTVNKAIEYLDCHVGYH